MEKVHGNDKNSGKIKIQNCANLVIWLLVLFQDLTECIIVPPILTMTYVDILLIKKDRNC